MTEVATIETEAQKIERWRFDAFVRMGFDPETSTLLASFPAWRVDLRAIEAWLHNGCTHELVLSILGIEDDELSLYANNEAA